ncbi:aldehyde dehydrogenase, dimeric NADP-preferring-like, partial [Anoplophora glabripennis]|uniref:aldehyde dehydrogenase, dimeric NADP-preferring-like n=1 Tax=Anoplophora glabripennis TaxID=217634 RepID=UPI0008746445
AFIYPEPYGVVLVIGPWNYPLLISLSPMVGALAAGNCVVVKPSEITSNFAQIIAKLFPKYLDSNCYHVVTGGIPETTVLLEQKFDYIFYTGCSSVGKIIQKAASKFLTPLTLELGGKTPVYVDDRVDVNLAVSRILWGKCINAGQSCVAPDFILCSKEMEKKFIQAAKSQIKTWFGDDVKESPDFGRIVNDNHYRRIVKLMQ